MTSTEASPPPPIDDGRLRRCILGVAAAGGTLALGAMAVFGAAAAFSVAVGAGIATGNLWILGRVVTALLPTGAAGARAQSRAGWALVAGLKMVGLIAVVWLLMRHAVVSPLAMLVGFGALPIGIAIGSLVSDRNASPED
jgi:hypothetical protein